VVVYYGCVFVLGVCVWLCVVFVYGVGFLFWVAFVVMGEVWGCSRRGGFFLMTGDVGGMGGLFLSL